MTCQRREHRNNDAPALEGEKREISLKTSQQTVRFEAMFITRTTDG